MEKIDSMERNIAILQHESRTFKRELELERGTTKQERSKMVSHVKNMEVSFYLFENFKVHIDFFELSELIPRRYSRNSYGITDCSAQLLITSVGLMTLPQ